MLSSFLILAVLPLLAPTPPPAALCQNTNKGTTKFYHMPNYVLKECLSSQVTNVYQKLLLKKEKHICAPIHEGRPTWMRIKFLKECEYDLSTCWHDF